MIIKTEDIGIEIMQTEAEIYFLQQKKKENEVSISYLQDNIK